MFEQLNDNLYDLIQYLLLNLIHNFSGFIVEIDQYTIYIINIYNN